MLSFFKEIYQIWIIERPTQHAAALAYYSMFSFAPVIYVTFVVAGIFVRQISVDQVQFIRIEEVLGPEVAQFLQNAVTALAGKNVSGSPLISLISFLALLFAASGLFYQLQYALNTIFHAPLPGQGGTLRLIRQRLFAFLGVIGLGLFLALITVASVLFSVLDNMIAPERSLPDFDLLVVLATVTFVFSLIYKFLPEVKMAWRDVLPGGLLAAALITIGGKLVGLFLATGHFTSALDAAGAFAIILILFYYVAQVFLLGAVFIRVLSARSGSVEPNEKE